MGFRNHELSSCHHEAVKMVIQLQATTKHIGAQFSPAYSVEMAMNWRILLKILSSIRFLARQALALRGHNNDYFHSLTSPHRLLFSQVCVLVQLILVMPATNATSERSFSALRKVKTYLWNTRTQQRVNNLMVLHIHKDITDSLNWYRFWIYCWHWTIFVSFT